MQVEPYFKKPGEHVIVTKLVEVELRNTEPDPKRAVRLRGKSSELNVFSSDETPPDTVKLRKWLDMWLI